MFQYKEYIRPQTLDEAYELAQKKNNVVLGGMLWLKMGEGSHGTAIDLCNLGLDKIEETENAWTIGSYVNLRELEQNHDLNVFTKGAMEEAMQHIVGVQFRNTATVGGSIWGRYGFSDVYSIFLALGAKVRLHHAGEMSLEEFAGFSRKNRDILTHIIVPKKPENGGIQSERIVYITQRNTRTDFPVLTCAVSMCSAYSGKVASNLASTGETDELHSVNRESLCDFRVVIGARPAIARCIYDDRHILANAIAERGYITEQAAADLGEYVAEQLDFGSNIRAGADYRKRICKVLVKRACLQLTGYENVMASPEECGSEQEKQLQGKED